MSTHDTLADKASAKIAKRAQYEAFEFDVPEPGTVRVRNASYGVDADEHTYDVTIQHGDAVACTCPADEYGNGPCKHRVAASTTSAVLAAATPEVAPDGGATTRTPPETESETDDSLPEITHHVEPPAQGGEHYIRCEGCGVEVLGGDTSRLPHKDGCPHTPEGE
ncbi:SWIM zinc finger family protein [Halarchaeum nitratireducens]|uniref:SWIM-type domain-containing protein n=1 Tax=Halarchaeum nitratireducens TaxID=489913 RepID=A0A830GF67_9EURY|nr:SWIM zinc finger family protein [Halarchaeum nitratireducens]GGN26987.1 hypothetical protein GCM10009021_31870 [Halarchaeum nitratireducens]